MVCVGYCLYLVSVWLRVTARTRFVQQFSVIPSTVEKKCSRFFLGKFLEAAVGCCKQATTNFSFSF